jgi:hypothetical protein
VRFIAYWDRGKQHANFPVDDFIVEDGIVKLLKQKKDIPVVVGFFDMGFLDAWYVTEEKT